MSGDSRLVGWISNRIAQALNQSVDDVSDDIKRFNMKEDINKFFTDPGRQSLLFFRQTGDQNRLVLTDGTTEALKGTCVYFLKRTTTRAITAASVDNEVFCGSLPPVTTHVVGDDEKAKNTLLLAFYTILNNVFRCSLEASAASSNDWGDIAAGSPVIDSYVSDMNKFIDAIGLGNEAISDRVTLVAPGDISEFRNAGATQKLDITTVAIARWTRQLEVFLHDSDRVRVEGDTVGPQAELEFWRGRMARFNQITDQLAGGPEGFLKEAETYMMAQLAKLRKAAAAEGRVGEMDQVRTVAQWKAAKAAVNRGANEAKDNVKYLYTLERILEPLYRSPDPVQMSDAIAPLMSAVQMMHSIARYYSSAERMTGLFVKITNQMIIACRRHVRGCPKQAGTDPAKKPTIWDSDFTELMQRFDDCAALNNAYQAEYNRTKARVAANPHAKQFDFSPTHIFGNFNLFCARIEKLGAVVTTIGQYRTLARCTVPGMESIYSDFQRLADLFQRKPYDALDHRSPQFDNDYRTFTADITALEGRLRQFIDTTFEERTSTRLAIQTLKQFQGVLQRQSLADELEQKVLLVFGWYGAELGTIEEQYEAAKDAPPIPTDQPPVSGSIAWARHLLAQIEEPMQWFGGQSAIDTDDAVPTIQRYNTLSRTLLLFEDMWHEAWCQQTSMEGLGANLLTRSEAGLEVAFDRNLVTACKEAAWLQTHGLAVPDHILAVVRHEQRLVDHNDQLLALVADVAAAVAAVPPEAAGLMRHHMTGLDKALEPGVSVLTWSSLNVGTFLADVRATLDEVIRITGTVVDIISTRVHTNLAAIARTLTCLLPRDGRVFTIDEYTAEQTEHAAAAALSMETKSQLAEEAFNDIVTLVGPDVSPDEVEAFYKRCHDQAYSAVYTSTYRSLRELLARLPPIAADTVTSSAPLFTISLELRIPQHVFAPTLAEVGEAVTTTVQSVLGVSRHVYCWGQPRAPAGAEQPSGLKAFFGQVSRSPTLVKQCLVALGRYNRLTAMAMECVADFTQYDHLWSESKADTYRSFLDTAPTVDEFGTRIAHYSGLQDELTARPDVTAFSVLSINISPLKLALLNEVANWKRTFATNLNERAKADLLSLSSYMTELDASLSRDVTDLDDVGAVMASLESLRGTEAEIDHRIVPLEEMYVMLARNEVHVSTEEVEAFESLRYKWTQLTGLAQKQSDHISELQPAFKQELITTVGAFVEDVAAFKTDYDERGPMVPGLAPREAAERLKEFQAAFEDRDRSWTAYRSGEELFGMPQTEFPALVQMRKELKLLNALYGLYSDVLSTVSGYAEILWSDLNLEAISTQMADFQARCRRLPKAMRDWGAFLELKKVIDDFSETLPLVQMIANPAMRPRHWGGLGELCKTTFDVDNEAFKLRDLIEAALLDNKDEVEDICNAAVKETDIEAKLKTVEADWIDQEFSFASFKTRGELTLAPGETAELITMLEDTQMMLGSLVSNRYNAPFKKDIMLWVARLSTASEAIEQWLQVQALWIYLEAVFSGGDIARQLPMEAKRFVNIDKTWVRIMSSAQANPNVVHVCYGDESLRSMLPHLAEQLELCQKSLSGYLETKRNLFPRFYFASDPVLLEILGQQSDPHSIQTHVQSLFDSVYRVTFDKVKRTMLTGLVAPQGEQLPLSLPVEGTGNIEDWLNELVTSMQTTIHDVIREAAVQVHVVGLEEFIGMFPAQVALLGVQLLWTHVCDQALQNAKTDKQVMAAAAKQNATLLNDLVRMTTQEMTKMQRTALGTLITIQVHQKDIIEELVRRRVRSVTDFEWLKQTRFYYRTESDECIISITDIDFDYAYEYLGVAERLVITPLTDRCYITLAQALGQYLGGAPAGPAGTGKTETVKDMGRSLGTYVVVFNCSDQMDYRGLGKIFRGLAQCGCFGCFDEFNRIELEVLSVAAQQVGCILSALKEHKKEFVFTDGQTVPLLTTCAYFITMNPGYAGRQELPENLKAQFRTVSMMVPNRQIIMRVKLAASGFSKQIELSKKFFVLYQLCEEQLSGQRHYDFGLRNILSVLRTCGTTKRANPDQSEDQILMRVLRDMNMSKMVDDDVQLFLSLISDLFPGQTVKKEHYPELEAAIEHVVGDADIVNHPDWNLRVVQLYETALVRHGIMVLGPSGAGKCLARGTKVLMATGQYRVVEDLRPGDMIMGAEGTPQTIITCSTGREKMAKITTVTDETFTTNMSHVITVVFRAGFPRVQVQSSAPSGQRYVVEFARLVRDPATGEGLALKGDGKSFDDEAQAQEFCDRISAAGATLENGDFPVTQHDMYDLSVAAFLAAPRTIQEAACMVHAPRIEAFSAAPAPPVPITPVPDGCPTLEWVLGMYLADGTCGDTPTVITADPEVVEALHVWAPTIGCSVTKHTTDGSVSYSIAGAQTQCNPFLNYLRDSGINTGAGHVPTPIKFGTPQQRLDLLAGFIDAQGTLDGTGFDVSHVPGQLVEDVKFIARSLGLVCNDRPDSDDRFTVVDGSPIPTRLPTKKAPAPVDEDSTRVAFHITELPEDDYFGFTMSGDTERFIVTEHMLVTHNTRCIQTLAGALSHCGDKHLCVRLNPKAFTASQMFGRLDAATNDWTDGIFAALWRRATKRQKENTWFVLDGPVDAVWIENLNTVLDDNKTLTLANSDRIPMTSLMKLIFEVDSLANASPATVSRNGMVYMSDRALGWRPVFQAWVKARSAQSQTLTGLFDKYMDAALVFIRDHTLPVMDVPSLSPGANVMALIDAMDPLPRDNEEKKKYVEMSAAQVERTFLFSLMWGVAGCLTAEDQAKFHDWVMGAAFRGAQRPAVQRGGSVYDYFVDRVSGEWRHWSARVPTFEYPGDTVPDFHGIMVPTIDNVRATFLLNALLAQQKPVLFVGESGTAKTVTVLQYLDQQDTDRFLCKTINFSSATTPNMVQNTIESYVEKRMGSIYGPPANKDGLFFIDNIAAPNINEWGDTPTNEIVRQIIAEHGMYSLERPGDWHGLAGLLFMGAMPCPGGGRNDLPARLKRQFVTFSMTLPSAEQIDHIYGTIIEGYFTESRGFGPDVVATAAQLIGATRAMWSATKVKMLPTPAKFHYIFNLRDLSRVSEGLLLADSEVITGTDRLLQLWKHECDRVMPDKFTTQADMDWFETRIADVIKTHFGADRVGPATTKARWVDFMRDAPEIDDPDVVPEVPKIYEPVTELSDLKERLEFFQEQYNEVNRRSQMSLVLFEAAVDHVCRISRIIRLPRGNALLVGVGGSGKQSLTRIASFVAGYETFQITITRGYNASSLEDDLKLLYRTAGVEGKGVTFLFTDNEIKEEAFLEYINNILLSGEVPGLFPKDEMEAIYSDVRPVLRAEQPRAIDTNDNVWRFFIDRVRANLHIVLCMSPVGDKFRTRARYFPGLISCATDWFQPWPEQALLDVARRYLGDFEMDATDEVRAALVQHIAFVHAKMNDISADYFNRFRRHAYVTPKSYLSFLESFKELYTRKRTEIGVLADRLNVGLNKLIGAGDDVAAMKVELEQKDKDLEVAQKQAAEMLKEITASTAVAEKVKAEVQAVKDEMQGTADVIATEKAKAEKHLEAAIPALEAAEEALNMIKPADIATVKKLAKPPNLIMRIMDGVLTLKRMDLDKALHDPDKDPAHFPVPSWKVAQRMMNDTGFLNSLLAFPKDEITDETVELLQPYLEMPDFNFEAAKKVSGNVAGLCSWCRAMATYQVIAQEVEPLKAKVRAMEAQFAVAMKDLAVAQAELDEKQAQLDELTARYDAAMSEKQRLQDDADLTRKRMTAANALINGLSGERTRWTAQSEEFAETIRRLSGDVVIAAAFMSYCGPYNQAFRQQLMTEVWATNLNKADIPFTAGIDATIHRFLVSESVVGGWNLQGLPTDVISTQNGIMVTTSTRYPLLVDPQGQANAWIRSREEANQLKVTTLDDKYFRAHIEDALNFGMPILIEGVEEELDPMLDPILEKQFIKSGRGLKVRVGDKECDVSDGFRLYITTKLPRPHYSPEVSAKTSVIDFTVTMVGLTEQLLTRVVNKEKCELEQQRRALLEDVNANKKMKEQLESDLLERLSSTKGNLLDDATLIDVLAQTKKTAQEVDEKLADAVLMEVKINEAREEFRPVAVRGSIIYFLVAEMSIISHMYQTSLVQFLTLFDAAIEEADASPITAKRIGNIIEHSTFSIFLYIQRGLFERDKMLFVLQLCLKIDLDSKAIDMIEFSALSKGGAALDIATLPPKPNKWLPDSAWLHLNALKVVAPFSRITDAIKEADAAWKAWYDHSSPEEEAVPGMPNITPFHKLLLVRCFREDRTMLAATGYIISSLGQKYAEGQPLDIEGTWRESAPGIPLLCILSLGSDPTAQLEAVAKKQKIPVSAISMGQGQEVLARQLFKQCSEQGGWLLLSNCHLGLRFMAELEGLVAGVDPEAVHPTFRVWITTEPHNRFPIGLLQMAIKFSNEPPSGVKAGLRRTFQWATQDMIEAVDKPEWGHMLYTLTFLHTVVQERRKYKPIGFCFPETDHQLLTDQGFMFLHEVEAYMEARGEDVTSCSLKFASYDDKTGNLIFERPTSVVINDASTQELVDMSEDIARDKWNGIVRDEDEGVRLSNNVSILATTGHRMYVKRGYYSGAQKHVEWQAYIPEEDRTHTGKSGRPRVRYPSEYTCVTAEGLTAPAEAKYDVYKLQAHAVEGVEHNGPIHLPAGVRNDQAKDFFRLYGFFLGDGYLEFLPDGTRCAVAFRQIKLVDHVFLIETLDRLGYAYTANDSRKFRVTEPTLLTFLGDEYQKKYKGWSGYDANAISAEQKLKSVKWMHPITWSLPKELLDAVLYGLVLADGLGDRVAADRSDAGQAGRVFTSGLHFRDEVVRVALMAGYSAHFIKSAEANEVRRGGVNPIIASVPSWTVRYCKRGAQRNCHYSEPTLVKEHIQTVSFTGRTWCIQQPHGFVVVRRAKTDAAGDVIEASRPTIQHNCIPYEFNQSDLSSSVQYLQTYMYTQDAKKPISWSTVRYMITEVLYGGRVTDDYDRRLLSAFGTHWFDQKMFNADFAFYPGYSIPPMQQITEVQKYVETLPLLDNPEIFGMHSNAELTYRMAEAKEILEKIVAIQPKDSSGTGGETREDVVMRIATEMLAKLPPDYDIHKTRDLIKRQGGYTVPLNVFLGQEIDKLQILIGAMRATLTDLRLAIQGTIIMSAALQASLDALYDARVPPHWLKVSWPSSTLGYWLADMLRRCDQNTTWLETKRPMAYWLAGFYNPQGFLTAVKQEITRAHTGWALDSVVVNTSVLKIEDHTAIQAPPSEGVYIYGLVLDGGGWSRKTGSLVDAPAKVLSVPLPILHVGAQNTPLQGLTKMYRCPVYTLPSRCDFNFVFDVYLPTADPPIKWILRGAALLCTTNE